MRWKFDVKIHSISNEAVNKWVHREKEGEEEKKTMSVIRGLPVSKSKRTKECDHGLFLTQYNHISHM